MMVNGNGRFINLPMTLDTLFEMMLVNELLLLFHSPYQIIFFFVFHSICVFNQPLYWSN